MDALAAASAASNVTGLHSEVAMAAAASNVSGLNAGIVGVSNHPGCMTRIILKGDSRVQFYTQWFGTLLLGKHTHF